MEKKIFLDKNDGLEIAVEQLIHAKLDTVILNIPKDSVLGRSVNNFHVLKREGTTAGKALMIESVDDHILELASLATITAINPVFQKTERAVSDILPRASVILKKKTAIFSEKSAEMPEVLKKDLEPTPQESIVSKEGQRPAVTFYSDRPKGDSVESNLPESQEQTSKKGMFALVISLVSIGVIIFIYLGWFVFPRATVLVTLKQKEVPFEQGVTVSQSVAKTEFKNSNLLLRGQLVVSQGNIALPVAGVEQSTQDATFAGGIITVVNEFSVNSQKLVEKTRFETPDGKIFRLRSDEVIPGGTLVKGVLKPGMKEVSVIADKTGEEYNIGPIERFTIPGFKGTPRFEKFHGFSTTTMAGGSSGISISIASSTNGESEESIISKLRVSLEEKANILDSAGLFIRPEASAFVVTKRELQNSTSTPILFVEGTLKQIGFSEDELKQSLGDYFKKDAGEDMYMKSIQISYATSSPDFSTGSLTTMVRGSILFEQDINMDELKQSVLGKKTNEVKGFMLTIPGVESATIKYRFPWTMRVPADPQKVEIRTE